MVLTFQIWTGCQIKKNLKIVNKELSDTFNLPIGYELVRDVGWRLPIIIYEKIIL